MKDNVFKTNDSTNMEFLKEQKLTELIDQWKGTPEVFERNPEDYGVKTCIESDDVEDEDLIVVDKNDDVEKDPICFQEYLGMLREVVTAVEGGESFDTIKINYCKTDWSRLKKKVEEFENFKLPVRADKLNVVENAGLRSKGTIVLEDMMIKKQFTVLDILKKILAYYD